MNDTTGAPPATVEPMSDLARKFAGRNGDYYARQFERLGEARSFAWTFNWAAAVLGPLWLAGRSLWGMFWVFLLAEMVAFVQLGRGLWGDLGAEDAARGGEAQPIGGEKGSPRRSRRRPRERPTPRASPRQPNTWRRTRSRRRPRPIRPPHWPPSCWRWVSSCCCWSRARRACWRTGRWRDASCGGARSDPCLRASTRRDCWGPEP